jgi:hypothetical protein
LISGSYQLECEWRKKKTINAWQNEANGFALNASSLRSMKIDRNFSLIESFLPALTLDDARGNVVDKTGATAQEYRFLTVCVNDCTRAKIESSCHWY